MAEGTVKSSEATYGSSWGGDWTSVGYTYVGEPKRVWFVVFDDGPTTGVFDTSFGWLVPNRTGDMKLVAYDTEYQRAMELAGKEDALFLTPKEAVEDALKSRQAQIATLKAELKVLSSLLARVEEAEASDGEQNV